MDEDERARIGPSSHRPWCGAGPGGGKGSRALPLLLSALCLPLLHQQRRFTMHAPTCPSLSKPHPLLPFISSTEPGQFLQPQVCCVPPALQRGPCSRYCPGYPGSRATCHCPFATLYPCAWAPHTSPIPLLYHAASPKSTWHHAQLHHQPLLKTGPGVSVTPR